MAARLTSVEIEAKKGLDRDAAAQDGHLWSEVQSKRGRIEGSVFEECRKGESAGIGMSGRSVNKYPREVKNSHRSDLGTHHADYGT